MKILLVAATEAEIAPTITRLQNEEGKLPWKISTCITGVGLMAATFSLTRVLMEAQYDFVLQAGIGGSFDSGIPLGSLVLVEQETLGDLGAEDRGDFIDIFNLGFVKGDEFPFKGGSLVNPMQDMPFRSDLPVVSGLTVHTVSGHAPTIAARRGRYRADVESMEGAALHYVCLQLGVPFLQLRAVSNYVTPRDRSAWEIGKAVKALNEQLIRWLCPSL